MNRQATTHHKVRADESPAKQKRHRRSLGGKKRDHLQAEVPREIRHAMIAEAAYYLAEKRGFAPGDEMTDWVQAEAEIESMLEKFVH